MTVDVPMVNIIDFYPKQNQIEKIQSKHKGCIIFVSPNERFVSYSSGKGKPSNWKSSSSPGGEKCALMQQTAHDGKGTLISLPRTPQHHLTS